MPLRSLLKMWCDALFENVSIIYLYMTNTDYIASLGCEEYTISYVDIEYCKGN